jgi:hypothetical protein
MAVNIISVGRNLNIPQCFCLDENQIDKGKIIIPRAAVAFGLKNIPLGAPIKTGIILSALPINPIV